MGMDVVGFMFGMEASAIVSTPLGKGYKKEQNNILMIVLVSVIDGFILTIVGLIYIRHIAVVIGTAENIL